MAGINPAANLLPAVAAPAAQQAVNAAAPPGLAQAPIDINALPLAAPAPELLGNPGIAPGVPAFSSTEIMVVLTQLMQNLSSVGNKRNSIATAYLRSVGAFSMRPLETGVKVRKADNDGYFQALGYEA